MEPGRLSMLCSPGDGAIDEPFVSRSIWEGRERETETTMRCYYEHGCCWLFRRAHPSFDSTAGSIRLCFLTLLAFRISHVIPFWHGISVVYIGLSCLFQCQIRDDGNAVFRCCCNCISERDIGSRPKLPHMSAQWLTHILSHTLTYLALVASEARGNLCIIGKP